MCLCDLIDYAPERRTKLATLESVIRMRDAVREFDAVNKFMPAADTGSVTPPRIAGSVAGAYFSQGEAA